MRAGWEYRYLSRVGKDDGAEGAAVDGARVGRDDLRPKRGDDLPAWLEGRGMGRELAWWGVVAAGRGDERAYLVVAVGAGRVGGVALSVGRDDDDVGLCRGAAVKAQTQR